MSTSYTIKNQVIGLLQPVNNEGEREEFEYFYDVTFSVTPREACTSTYPGAEPEIVDIVVTLTPASKEGLYPLAIPMIEEEIEEKLNEDPADLWDHVTREREAAADYANER